MSRAYYQVEPGSEVHAFCVDWRERQIEIGERLTAWAEAKGAERWIVGFDGSLVSLVFPGEPPVGWRRAKTLSADGYVRYTPMKRTEEGKAIAAEIAKLEKLPSHDEFLDKFNFPRAVKVKGPNATGTWALAPGRLSVCDMGWIGDTYWIVLPNLEEFYEQLEREGMEVDGDPIMLPKGMTKSSRARYDLALAQHAVDMEEKEAA